MTDILEDRDAVRAWLAEHVFAPDPDAPRHGRVGLEAEFFPFWLARDGAPAARLALVELIGIVDGIAGAERNPDSPGGRPSWQLDGVLITEEPGAQIEAAGPPEVDAGTAIDHLERVVDRLAAAFDDDGAALAAAGLDCWSEAEQVPVQLSIPRYDAMTTYFGRRGGSEGHLLMCASCSVQVNVDLGPPDLARRRWLLANLAAPVITAAFAASPTQEAVNGRSLDWRGLDPSRTGVPPPLVAGVDDPLEQVLADTLRADVMMLQRDGRWHAGEPGWSFGDWVDRGDARFGPPTVDDLEVHLTTLFPEARLRGYMEIRGVDALPRPWRGASIALVVGLLYDEDAVEAALARLRPHRAQVSDLLERAGRRGLADPVIGDLAGPVLEAALDGARRLGIPQAEVADAYLDRFTRRGRHPADELREALGRGSRDAFAWARDPRP